jgi:hypothetical protein
MTSTASPAMLIGGEWVGAAGGETFESGHPFLGAAGALAPARSRRRARRSGPE